MWKLFVTLLLITYIVAETISPDKCESQSGQSGSLLVNIPANQLDQELKFSWNHDGAWNVKIKVCNLGPNNVIITGNANHVRVSFWIFLVLLLI